MKNWVVTALIWLTVFTTNAGQLPGTKPTPVHVVSRGAGIDITTLKVVHVLGPVTQYSARESINEAMNTANIPGDRVVVIDSPGGDVDAGQKLITVLLLEHALGTRIVCVVHNNAHSMGFNILSFCDVKLATAKSTMVVHKIAFGMIPPGIRGTALNLREMARELDLADEPYILQNSKMMHLDRKHYNMYANRENRWTAEQLLAMGYLDGIATVK